MEAGNSDSVSYKFMLSFNCCRINKGVVISKQTVVLHRWENTLAKYRVLSVTCDHYDNRKRLRLPLIFVFTYISTTRPVTKAYLSS